MDETPTPTDCIACRILDTADGSYDHVIGTAPVARVRSENSVLAAFRRAEDQTADRITQFAGSMRFV